MHCICGYYLLLRLLGRALLFAPMKAPAKKAANIPA
jgi:hypothetical protein